MIKVLIVEDEMIVRAGIKSLIDWEANGFEIIGDAQDGLSALDIIENNIPDIVLTDIVMPNMDGLELTTHIVDRYPDIKIIILSCHNDYEYVRRAMKLGAKDYLLKLSMKPQELLNVMIEVAKSIDKGLPANHDAHKPVDNDRTQLVSYLTYGDVENPKIDELIEKMDMDWLNDKIVFFLINILDLYKKEAHIEKRLNLFMDLLHQTLRDYPGYQIMRYSPEKYGILLSTQGDSNLDLLQNLASDLTMLMKRYINIHIVVGVSDRVDSYKMMKTAYEQAENAMSERYYDRDKHVFIYKSKRDECGSDILSPQFEEELIKRAETCDYENLEKCIDSVIDEINRQKLEIEYDMQIFMEILHCLKEPLKQYDTDLEKLLDLNEPLYGQLSHLHSLDDTRSWFHTLLLKYCEALKTLKKLMYRDEIKDLVDYIHTNYHDHLNLKKAAQMLNISESHLSRIFKKSLGMNFTDYVTKVRMDKACVLLKNRDMTSYEVAYRIGYENVNYFGRVFKKVVGLSPSEYKKNYIK